MRTANLFIFGTPRSGTTSLAFWLAEHPEIVMSRPKEPGFHAVGLLMADRVTDLATYAECFAKATDERYLLDATPWYLYSPGAAASVVASESDARVIVMLRKPSEMLPSLHHHHVFHGLESERDPAVALFTSRPPDDVDFRRSLDFIDVGRVGAQVERLLEHVPAERVQFVQFEQLRTQPAATHAQVLRSLGLEEVPLESYERMNPARHQRSSHVTSLVDAVTGDSSSTLRRKIAGRIREMNARRREIEIPIAIRRRIVDALSDDIDLLAQITGLDLSDWKRP